MVNETKKDKRTPTEKKSQVLDFFEKIWGNVVKDDFVPFIKWSVGDNNETFADIEFLEDAPTPYTNKWEREQLKMKVIQEGIESVISGGKRLFIALKQFCLHEEKKPTELGIVRLFRIGNGFNISYRFEFH